MSGKGKEVSEHEAGLYVFRIFDVCVLFYVEVFLVVQGD